MINIKRRIAVCLAILSALSILWPIWRGLPALSETLGEFQSGWQAQTFWVDIEGLNRDEPMRLWQSFIKVDSDTAGIMDGSQLLLDSLTMEELRLVMLVVYASQMEALKPKTVLDADEMRLYILDPYYGNALLLDGLSGTIAGLWDAARGASGLSALDRSFTGKANPMGILRSSCLLYLKRRGIAGTLNLSESEILERSKQMYDSQPEFKQTGFILLLAPENAVAAPREVEIRRDIDTDEKAMSAKRLKGHTRTKVEGIAPASGQLTQMRVKSGVFLDIRLYNNGKQVPFRQRTGSCESGPCLDFILYGKLKDYQTLQLGMTGHALSKLKELGIKTIHICLASTSGNYKEFWQTVAID